MLPRLSRQKTVFLLGFGLGFAFAVIFPSFANIFEGVGVSRIFSTHDENARYEVSRSPGDRKLRSKKSRYEDWLHSQGMRSYNLDLDRYFYGPKDDNAARIVPESDWLKSRILVTCVVFVEKPGTTEIVKATWGKRCDDLLFFGRRIKDFKREDVIKLDVEISSSWHLLCEAMNFLRTNRKTLEWIIFAKEDTVVIPENLRYFVAPLDYKGDHYIGHPVVLWGCAYNLARSGYVLSKGALEKITAMFNTTQKCITGGKYWKREDYYLGKHLASLGIYPSDTRDQHSRSTFHGYSLQHLLWGIEKNGNYWTRALYPPNEKSCCSPTTIAFAAGEYSKMYTMDYLLYHLHVYVSTAKFGNVSAPTSIPEADVWRIALKEEFNVSYTKDISDDEYYKLWRSKYSEPEEFISRHSRNRRRTVKRTNFIGVSNVCDTGKVKYREKKR